MNRMFYIVCFLLIYSQSVVSEPAKKPYDSASDQALIETQNLLRSRTEREKLIQKDQKAKKADDQVTSVVGEGQIKDEMYDVTAGIMKYLVEKYSGDAEKMQAEMLKAASDPKAFLSSLPIEYQNKIRAMASEVEAKKIKP